jgi:tetratricopeptide (TPR) repeat protein
MTNPHRQILLYAVLVFMLMLIAYANHFHNGFHFDDAHAVVDNVHIRSLKVIPASFYNPRMFSNDPLHWGIRAMVTSTLAIDYWLGSGLNPFYFQLDTFIWYVALCVLIYFMYHRLLVFSSNQTRAVYIALCATAWYALHTANAETLNYIIARSDVQSTFFIVLAFLIYALWPAKRKWYIYLIPAIIGVFAKETMLVLVILVFFYDLLFEQGLSLYNVFNKRHFKNVVVASGRILPLLIVVGLAQYYTLSRIPGVPGISNPFFPYLLTQAYVWLHYFTSFFLPVHLSADSDWSVIANPFDWRIIIGLLFVVLLTAAIFKASKNEATRPVAFGLIWFAAALLPTSLAPFAEVMNDHRMFFPFIGLSFSVISFIGAWLRQHAQVLEIYRKPILAVFAAVLLLNAYGVYARNKVWKNEETLWLDVTKKSPLNGRGLMNYGLTQMQKGNYLIAGRYFNKALNYLPYYSTLYINRGVLYGAMNEPTEAEINFKKAITYSPDDFNSYAFYARYLQRSGRWAEALPLAEKALQLNPYSLMTMNVLLPVYNALNNWDKLQNTANKVLAITPGDNTALMYAKAAKSHVSYIEIAAKESGTKLTADDYVNLSLESYNRKDYQKCIEECRKALNLKPDNAAAYNNIGAAYNQLGQWDKAIEACSKALQIDPGNQLARGNLNFAKSHPEK